MKRLALVVVVVLLAAGGGVAWAAQSTPAVGTAAEDVELSTVAGSTPFEDGWAIPLAGAKPAWLTPELDAQVHAAEGQPVAAPVDAPLPSEVGIRPGSWMISPAGCTMNFVFQKSSALAIGTAGHCVDKLGQSVILITLAPGGANPVLVDVGTVIAKHDNGIGDDFALVSIRPVLYPWVSATMALIGGPCGAYTGSGPETVWHYGHGIGIGTGGTPRSGVALRWTANDFGWVGAAIFGDSGSGVRVTDLKAAGDLTHLVVNTKWLPNFIGGTRIGKMLSIAKGYSLVSSPLCL